jgi:hypothetical protein
MRHHTKDKGDQGLGFVIADLMASGIHVALPISEHLPFDCIAINSAGDMKRVSVKYRTAPKGVIDCRKRSSWVDRRGVHYKKHTPGSYDAFAIYCPDTKQCYYVREEESSGSLRLRITKPRGTNGIAARFADEFKNPERLFVPVAQLDEQQPSKLLDAGSSPVGDTHEH